MFELSDIVLVLLILKLTFELNNKIVGIKNVLKIFSMSSIIVSYYTSEVTMYKVF